MSNRTYHAETLAVHAGQDAHGDPATNALAVLSGVDFPEYFE